MAGQLACTSQPCLWNNPRKRKLSPKRSSELKFHKDKDGNRNKNEEQYSRNTLVLSEKCIPYLERFHEKLLRKCPSAGWLTLYKPVVKRVPKLLHINFCYCDQINLNSEECRQHFQTFFSLMATEDDTNITLNINGTIHPISILAPQKILKNYVMSWVLKLRKKFI